MNFHLVEKMIVVNNLGSFDSKISEPVFLVKTVTEVYNQIRQGIKVFRKVYFLLIEHIKELTKTIFHGVLFGLDCIFADANLNVAELLFGKPKAFN